MHLIKDTNYYTICQRPDGQFVAEMKGQALCGVPGISFTLNDTVKSRLIARANKVVEETLNPHDPVLRHLAVRPQQLELIS